MELKAFIRSLPKLQP